MVVRVGWIRAGQRHRFQVIILIISAICKAHLAAVLSSSSSCRKSNTRNHSSSCPDFPKQTHAFHVTFAHHNVNSNKCDNPQTRMNLYVFPQSLVRMLNSVIKETTHYAFVFPKFPKTSCLKTMPSSKVNTPKAEESGLVNVKDKVEHVTAEFNSLSKWTPKKRQETLKKKYHKRESINVVSKM